MVAVGFVIFMIIVSLALIVKGADYLVDGAADIARWLRVSPVLVGLTVVAFGTSLPEFIVSLFSVFGGKADLSIGTVIGSNIANIAIGIGVAALVLPLIIKSKTLIYELPFLIIANFLLLILATDHFIFSKDTFILGRIDGLILLIIFVIFLYYIYQSLKETNKSVKKQFSKEFRHKNSWLKNTAYIIGGIAALIGGGKLLIMYGSDLARDAGLSEAFIGLTVFAIGTSLPEIVASITAAFKKEGDLAVGNILGSNVFNILFVLGTTSVLKPIKVNPLVLAVDGMVLLLISLLFLVFATSEKKVSRIEGVILVLIYIVYFGFLIWRL